MEKRVGQTQGTAGGENRRIGEYRQGEGLLLLPLVQITTLSMDHIPLCSRSWLSESSSERIFSGTSSYYGCCQSLPSSIRASERFLCVPARLCCGLISL